METCSSGHEEILFLSRKCPLCETIEDKDSQISDLKSQIEDLEKQLEENS